MAINIRMLYKLFIAKKKNSLARNNMRAIFANEEKSRQEFEFQEHFNSDELLRFLRQLCVETPKTVSANQKRFLFIHFIIPFACVIIYIVRKWKRAAKESCDVSIATRWMIDVELSLSSECLKLFSSFIRLQYSNGSCVLHKVSCRIAFCMLLN